MLLSDRVKRALIVLTFTTQYPPVRLPKPRHVDDVMKRREGRLVAVAFCEEVGPVRLSILHLDGGARLLLSELRGVVVERDEWQGAAYRADETRSTRRRSRRGHGSERFSMR